MKTQGIIDGIFFAALVSLAAGAASVILSGFVSVSTLFNVMLCAVALLYLVYLLKRSGARIGRIAVVCAWLLISLLCWLLRVPLVEQVCIQAGLIWLVRSLYFHGSIIAAGLDLALVAGGLVAGAWAIMNTGSLTAALWCFFLAQSFFCLIPDLAQRQGYEPISASPATSTFQSAHCVALDAVRKLTQP